MRIRFCTSSDGVRLAYATSGAGLPLVKAANYLTHLEHDWHGPVWRHWLQELGSRHTLVRYDERGCGLSDRNVEQYSIDAWVDDLEAVVDSLRLDRFPLLGISQGAAVCIAYAVRHPEKVSHLVLYGGYGQGRCRRGRRPEEDPDLALEVDTLLNVIRVGWGRDNPAFRQLFSTHLMPEGSREQFACLNDLARVSASPEEAVRMTQAFYEIDITDLAPLVRTPTLILHARDDATVPFEESRRLAALIPDARLVPLEGRNHILREEEPAWRRFLDEMYGFLRTGAATPDQAAPYSDLTGRERDVLDLVARGLSNEQIADRLGISVKTVRNHITHLFSKLDVTRRAEAIVRARDAGFGRDHR